MLTYSFSTPSIKDVDIRRIVRENSAPILYVNGGDISSLLLIHRAFLEQFTFTDGIFVGEERLFPTAGLPQCRLEQAGPNTWAPFALQTIDTAVPDTDPYRAFVTRDSAESIEQQFRDARKFLTQRKFKTTVCTIGKAGVL